MTLDHVRQAKEAIEREGRTPSYNAVLTRVGHGSKRDVARLMQQLTAAVPVPMLTDDSVPALGDVPVPDRAALGAAEPLQDPPGPPLPPPPAPPLPPEPPLPPAAAPLARARQQRDQTAAQEHALGLEEQRLKVERQAVEQDELALTIQRGSAQQSDVVDLAHRGRQRALALQRMQIEAERLQVHRTRREAFEAKLQAADAYHAAQGQAARWLRRLREAQRGVQAGSSAFARGEAREELAQVLAQLAALIGPTDAQALAADPQHRPAWLQE